MLIAVRHSFIFVANMNASEEVVENILAPFAEIARIGSAGRRSIAWSDIRSEYNFLFEGVNTRPTSFFKFGIIREPVDWVIEFFRKSLSLKSEDLNLNRYQEEYTNFERWWLESKDDLWNWDQAHCFSNFDGRCAMDLLIPFQNIEEGLCRVAEKLNLPLSDFKLHDQSSEPVIEVSSPLRKEIREFFSESNILYEGSVCKYKVFGFNRRPNIRINPLGIVYKEIIQDVQCSDDECKVFTISGILLLQAAINTEYQLLLKNTRHNGDIQTLLASPWLAKKYPHHPKSSKARFVISDIAPLNDTTTVVQLLLDGALHDWLYISY
jgi:hypothetical protein